MDFLKNINHVVICPDLIENYSLNIKELKMQLKVNEEEIYKLREKVATYEYMKEQITNFKIKQKDLEHILKYTIENQKQCYDNISQDLEIKSTKYKETLENIDKLYKKIHDLQNSIQFNKSKRLKLIVNINKLKIMNLKAIKYNNELQKKAHKYQVIY